MEDAWSFSINGHETVVILRGSHRAIEWLLKNREKYSRDVRTQCAHKNFDSDTFRSGFLCKRDYDRVPIA